MNREEFREFRKKMLLEKLARKRGRTINQVINAIYERDLEKGKDFALARGWKFYTHLNKLFAPMERDNLVKHIGYDKQGEKLWVRL